MPRIRTVKPDFFRSLTIAELPVEARLTFIALWTYVDDEGRGVDDPRLIKAYAWPLDDRTASDVDADLAAIEALGLVERYEVEGRRYLHVRTFHEHQKVSHAQPSSLPAPEHSINVPGAFPEGSVNVPGTFSAERKGMEGKGTTTRRQPPAAAGGVEAFEVDFARAWEHYPRKDGRKAALRAYQARRKAQVSAEDLLTATKHYAETRRGEDPRFTKHGSTFYGADDHWKDYLDPPAPPAQREREFSGEPWMQPGGVEL